MKNVKMKIIMLKKNIEFLLWWSRSRSPSPFLAEHNDAFFTPSELLLKFCKASSEKSGSGGFIVVVISPYISNNCLNASYMKIMEISAAKLSSVNRVM